MTAAFLIRIITSLILNDGLKAIYESTCAGNKPCPHCFWTVLVNDYYYPCANPFSSLSSHFYFFGYLKGYGQQTFFPDLPTLVVYSQYLSDGANSFISSHGQSFGTKLFLELS